MKSEQLESGLSRRELVKAAGMLAACAATGYGAAAQSTPSPEEPRPRASRSRVLRIAHLTDVHVQPERKAGEGLASCLRHVQGLADKPDIILNGGDAIMDSMGKDEARTRLQWELWQKVLKDETSLPIENCIGNHDVWGWSKKSSHASGSEAQYGKKWAMDVFGIERPYRSFDRAGWHFIVLDSVFPHGEGYRARLDDEQFEWLKGDVAGVDAKTPILVLSHIPIVSACVMFNGDNEKSGNWVVPGALVHLDARKIKDLFYKHGNVKLCLSGHLHLVDRVDYLGVTYLCHGAVSGNWWKGDHQECRPGYAMINLFSDGGFEHEYVPYGWVAAPA